MPEQRHDLPTHDELLQAANNPRMKNLLSRLCDTVFATEADHYTVPEIATLGAGLLAISLAWCADHLEVTEGTKAAFVDQVLNFADDGYRMIQDPAGQEMEDEIMERVKERREQQGQEMHPLYKALGDPAVIALSNLVINAVYTEIGGGPEERSKYNIGQILAGVTIGAVGVTVEHLQDYPIETRQEIASQVISFLQERLYTSLTFNSPN